jgi:hypothetical protein
MELVFLSHKERYHLIEIKSVRLMASQPFGAFRGAIFVRRY